MPPQELRVSNIIGTMKRVEKKALLEDIRECLSVIVLGYLCLGWQVRRNCKKIKTRIKEKT